MKQYFDKEAIVAEIEKIYNEDYKFLPSDLVTSVLNFKYDLLLALDTSLEVKEVDLEKEIDVYSNALPCRREDIEIIAKHFFELGLKMKGE